jgi:hypothetical protein
MYGYFGQTPPAPAPTEPAQATPTWGIALLGALFGAFVTYEYMDAKIGRVHKQSQASYRYLARRGDYYKKRAKK